DDVFRCVARHGFRHEVAHQKPRDRRVPVGKVEYRRTFPSITCAGVTHAVRPTLLQFEPLESGEAEAPTIERGLAIDACSPLVVCDGLVEGERLRPALHVIAKISEIGDAAELVLLL